jgi:hypothetical protein
MIVPLLLLGLTIVEPWVLISQVTRQECRQGQCQPMARQPLPQERQVQTFAAAEDCLKTRDAMQRQVLDAVEPVNQIVHARTPNWYMRLTTTFVCRQAAGTTGEQ